MIELAQPSYGLEFLESGKIFVHSNESTVHGRMVIQGEFLRPRPVLCGSSCCADRGCIGFAMKSTLCNLILIYPKPEADSLTSISNGTSRIWIKRDLQYPTSCLDAKYWYQGFAISGSYWIVIPGTYNPVEVYCDMTTASGGWTLVWSYGFTNYGDFKNQANAIEPMPSTGWTTGNNIDVESSKIIPTDPKMHGAMEFALWARIGSNFLVRLNINNEIMCSPGIGSIVTATAGSVSCSLVEDVVHEENCTDAPNYYDFRFQGSVLKKNHYMYYWDANKNGVDWPTHDPCMENEANQKTGVINPGGQLFLMDYPTSRE